MSRSFRKNPATLKNYKFISAFFGAIFGLAGVFLGIILVLKPQLLGSKALMVGYIPPIATPSNLLECSFNTPCQPGWAAGATKCITKSGSGTAYCCAEDQNLINNVCFDKDDLKECEKGLYCQWDNPPVGSRMCLGDGLAYCCPKGKIIKDGKCVLPFKTPASSATPDPCNKPWIKGKCGEGSCLSFQRYDYRIMPQGCGKVSRCVLDIECVK